MKTEFRETQKFKQWWLWLLLGAVALIPLYGLFQQVVLKQAFGNHPASNLVLLLVLLLQLGLLYFFWSMKMTTEINQSGIKMRFKPFATIEATWIDVYSIEIIKYGFVGYGMRFSRKYWTIYNMGGKFGLFVVLKNKRRFVIGTQCLEEMQAAIGAFYTVKMDDEMTKNK